MPLILAAAGHPGGAQLLELRDPAFTSRPVARGGIGCIPHVVYSSEDESPLEQEAHLRREVTELDFGLLITALRAALGSLHLTARDLQRVFDGTLHLPGVLQDLIMAAAAAFHERFAEVLEHTVGELSPPELLTLRAGTPTRREALRTATSSRPSPPASIRFPPTSWESRACASSPWLSVSTGP